MTIIKNVGDTTVDTTGYQLIFIDNITGTEVWWDGNIGENENVSGNIRVIETRVGKTIPNFNFTYSAVIVGGINLSQTEIDISSETIVIFG